MRCFTRSTHIPALPGSEVRSFIKSESRRSRVNNGAEELPGNDEQQRNDDSGKNRMG
jgi:hypothetical protein